MISFFFQAEDGIRDFHVTGVQTCALPIFQRSNALLQFVDLLTLIPDEGYQQSPQPITVARDGSIIVVRYIFYQARSLDIFRNQARNAANRFQRLVLLGRDLLPGLLLALDLLVTL